MRGLERHAVEVAGRTDGAIARDILLAAGMAPHDIDAGMASVHEAAVAAYSELCPDDLSHTVTPGIGELLERLGADGRYRQALVTGNLEPIARLKLERAGIGAHFEAGQGGFGSDSEARADLPRVARERAGGWARERTVVIGDTPRDIACARADRVRVVGVTTGSFGAVDLAEADAVCDGPSALEPVLADWA